MKKLNITLLAVFTTSVVYAGGTFVEPAYESEDIVFAEEAVVEEYPEEAYVEPLEEEYIEPVQEEYIEEEPVEQVREYVAPVKEPVKEVVIKEPVVVPPPKPIKNIKTNGFYAGIGISAAEFVPDCKKVGTSTTCTKQARDRTLGLMGRVGYDVNQYIGVEARGIRTNWKYDGGKVKHAGIFVKPMLPVGESANIYALAGVAKTTTQGYKQRVDTKSFAWGVGAEYDISQDKAKDGRYNRKFDGHGDQEKGLGIFADYERLVQKSGSPDLDTVNVGLTYDF